MKFKLSTPKSKSHTRNCFNMVNFCEHWNPSIY